MLLTICENDTILKNDSGFILAVFLKKLRHLALLYKGLKLELPSWLGSFLPPRQPGLTPRVSKYTALALVRICVRCTGLSINSNVNTSAYYWTLTATGIVQRAWKFVQGGWDGCWMGPTNTGLWEDQRSRLVFETNKQQVEFVCATQSWVVLGSIHDLFVTVTFCCLNLTADMFLLLRLCHSEPGVLLQPMASFPAVFVPLKAKCS